MKKWMKTWLYALVVTVAVVGSSALAQDATPVSAATMQKMQKFLDKIGSKENFPAPLAQELGLSDDPQKDLPVTVIVTNDHNVYFCRSDLDPNDYIVWVRRPDNQSSYMFLTHADFKPIRALLLRTAEFPQQQDLSSPKVRGIYKDALTALAKDVDSSPAP